MSFSPENSLGSFLATSTFFPAEWEQFRIKFIDLYQQIANATNTREISIYDANEVITGKLWYTPGNPQTFRPVYRKTFNFDDASLTFNHNITNLDLFVDWYGGGKDGAGNFFPLPYVDEVNVTNQISVIATTTQVAIQKGAGAPPTISDAYLVLEYLKN